MVLPASRSRARHGVSATTKTAACLFLLLSLGLIAGNTSAAAAPSAPGVLPAPVAAHWAKVRREFGFRSDSAYLAQVHTRRDTTVRDLGVPLTPAEAAEMARRGALGTFIGRVDKDGRGSRYFGGVRLNQSAGGVIEILIVGLGKTDPGARALERSLRADIPAGTAAASVSVPYSADTLSHAAQAVSDGLTRGNLRSLGVRTVSRRGESLHIGIISGAPGSAEKQLRARFPWPYVVIDRSANVLELQNRSFESGPLWGGEWISSSGGSGCTIGYSYMKYGTNFYSATAGHCGNPGENWRQGIYYTGNNFGHGQRYNGAMGSWSYGTTQRCDCQVIGPIPRSAATSGVLIANNDKYPYTYTPGNTSAYYYTGRSVCTSGAHYGDDHSNNIVCGTIQDVNATAYYSENNVSLIRLVTTTVRTTESGDSGAPVGSGHAFMGIHNGLLNGQQYFSRSTYLEATTTAYPTYA